MQTQKQKLDQNVPCLYQFTDYQTIQRRTKIVSTLGPKCSDVETLKKMLIAGVNVFRLNFSFGDHNSMRTLVSNIRQASKETKIPFSTLGDLQGPKFRTGKIEGGSIQLENGSKVHMKFSKEEIGNSQTIIVPHQLIMKSVKDNEKILLDDGTMELKVTKRISDTEIEVEVINGGKLKEHKGINLPGLLIHFDDILEKDKRDALLLLELQVDFVGVSFVQTSEDVYRLRKFLQQNAQEDQKIPQLISKIEKPQALEDIDNIIQASDGIMVARGDLGVELSLELTPVVQKMLIRKANEAGKPVITATQMLSSMETAEAPTRAEVSDIANAVFDGTDATMTSGETAMSSHPALVVETMGKILKTTEQFLLKSSRNHREGARPVGGEMDETRLRIAVAVSALEAAADAKAKAIIVFSDSGEMAKLISKGRPCCPIISFTPKKENKEQIINVLRLHYGVYPFELEFPKYIDTTLAKAENVIFTSDIKVKSGDWVVMCAGNNLPIPGLNNMTKIFRLGDFLKTYVEHFHLQDHSKKQ